MTDNHQIICGDASNVMAQMPNSSVDLIIADPPYNLNKDYGNGSDNQTWVEYERFTNAWLDEAVRLLKPDGSIYVFMGVRFIARLFHILDQERKLVFNTWITWHYTQGMGRKTGFSPRHEDILFFTKSQQCTFNLNEVRIPQKYFRERNNMAGANPGDVWQFSHVHYCSAEREQHPTQKPEALMERVIKASSRKGELVLDPFLGSGTTCKVAKLLGRRSVGIELNPDYVSMSIRRLQMASDRLDSFDPRTDRTPRDLPKKLERRKSRVLSSC